MFTPFLLFCLQPFRGPSLKAAEPAILRGVGKTRGVLDGELRSFRESLMHRIPRAQKDALYAKYKEAALTRRDPVAALKTLLVAGTGVPLFADAGSWDNDDWQQVSLITPEILGQSREARRALYVAAGYSAFGIRFMDNKWEPLHNEMLTHYPRDPHVLSRIGYYTSQRNTPTELPKLREMAETWENPTSFSPEVCPEVIRLRGALLNRISAFSYSKDMAKDGELAIRDYYRYMSHPEMRGQPTGYTRVLNGILEKIGSKRRVAPPR